MQPTSEQVSKALDGILNSLEVYNLDGLVETVGATNIMLYREAFAAYEEGDAQKLRQLAATNLNDNFCRSLGYAVSAKLKPELPTVTVVLAEAARAAADFVRDCEMKRLSSVIANALSQEAMPISA